jgi:hypothetical protein
VSPANGMVAEVSRRRDHMASVERRISELRDTEPQDERHARVLQQLIEWGERLLACHERHMEDAVERLTGLMADVPISRSFTVPVVAAGRASISPRPTDLPEHRLRR